MDEVTIGLQAVSLKETFPLLSVSDLVFEEIAKYLSPAALIKLQSTCKVMQEKCYRAQRVVTYRARCFRYVASNNISLCKKVNNSCVEFPFSIFFTTRFRLHCETLIIPKKSVDDVQLDHLSKLFSKRSCHADWLLIKTCNASAKTLSNFIKRFKITGIDSDAPSVFIHENIPAMKQVYSLWPFTSKIQITSFVAFDYADYNGDFLLNTNFDIMKIKNTYPISLNILRTLITDLIEGKRNASYWYLYDALKQNDDLAKLFEGYLVISAQEDCKYATRPRVVKYTTETYKIICKNEAEYRIFSIRHLVVRRCF